MIRLKSNFSSSSWTFCVAGRDDGLVRVKPLLDRAPRFADLLEGEPDAAAFAPIRRSELIGRPLGSAAFVAAIERSLGRVLAPGKRGRKPRREGQILRERRACQCARKLM